LTLSYGPHWGLVKNDKIPEKNSFFRNKDSIKLTFIVKQAKLAKDEPPFLPEHESVTSLLVQPTL